MKKTLLALLGLLAFMGAAYADNGAGVSLVTTPPTGAVVDLETTSPLNVGIAATDFATWAGGNLGGHINTSGTAPGLTTCGTGSPAITGTDTAGIVTMGTNATGCVITFHTAYGHVPFCVVTWIATPLASQSYVTAADKITLTQTSASGNKVQYVCIGNGS